MRISDRSAPLDMLTGPAFDCILRFTIPLALGNLLQQLYSFADACIVSRCIGADALGGIGASSSVQFLVLGFCTGYCSGIGVPVAQAVGARDRQAVSRCVVSGTAVTLALSMALCLLCAGLVDPILAALRTPEQVYANARAYLFIIFLGIPCSMAYNLGASVLRASGDSRSPFWYLVAASAVNILLDMLFVMGLGAGVAGAAAATVIAQGLGGALCFARIRAGGLVVPDGQSAGLRSQIQGRTCRRLLAIAVPMGFQSSVTAIGTFLVQRANNALGAVCTNAFAAGSKIRQFAMCPFDAIAAGAATFAAQNLGARQYGRIRRGIRLGVTAGVCYGLAAGMCLYLGCRPLSALLLERDTAAFASCAAYLRTVGVFLWLLGILNVCRMSVQNLGFPKLAFVSGLVELLSRILLCRWAVPALGFRAICLNEPNAWVFACCYILPVCVILVRKLERGADPRHV